jgi:hypothetical protein
MEKEEKSGLTAFGASRLALLWAFVAVLTITLLRSHSNHIAPKRRSFILKSIVSIMILYHLQSLSEVSILLPSNQSDASGKSIFRWECLRSNKGGKRPYGDTSVEYRNPCFVKDIEVNNTDAVVSETSATIEHHSSSLCSSSRTTAVTDPFISATRDCDNAQSSQCSYSQPCTPCELSRFKEFSESSRGWDRCQACSIKNRFGDCNFVHGLGPYCWKDADGWEVVPCRKCCTDGLSLRVRFDW